MNPIFVYLSIYVCNRHNNEEISEPNDDAMPCKWRTGVYARITTNKRECKNIKTGMSVCVGGLVQRIQR